MYKRQVCGLILLILSFPPGSKKDKEEEAGSPVVQGQLVPEAKEGDSDSQTAAGKISGTQEDEERRYEKEMEQRVKDILKNVDGVGEVDVMLTLKSSKEKVLHVDRDRSRSTTEEKDKMCIRDRFSSCREEWRRRKNFSVSAPGYMMNSGLTGCAPSVKAAWQ